MIKFIFEKKLTALKVALNIVLKSTEKLRNVSRVFYLIKICY